MKVVVFLCLLGLVVADDDWFNPTKKYGKWAKMQAMKVCYGEKAMEQWHVKHKKALKTCTGMPVPELDMWEQTKPYRMIHSMLKGMKDKQGGAMMEMMQKMHGANQMNNAPQVHVVTVPQTQENTMMKMMKMMMMKKMMKKMMSHHGGAHDDDEDDEGMSSMYKMDDDNDDMTGFQKFFSMMKESKGRYKRDADLYDLGDRLVEKLEMAQESMKAKIGNISCYLQETHIIDEDMNLDLQGMLKEWDSYDWNGNDWLKAKSKQGVKDCYDMVEAMPTNILARYGDVKMMKVKKMMMCCDMHKKMECMCNDAKQMLEKHFKPLPELVQETGMDEMTLLKMTHMLVEDSMDFM